MWKFLKPRMKVLSLREDLHLLGKYKTSIIGISFKRNSEFQVFEDSH
jgi:hypothetical protein